MTEVEALTDIGDLTLKDTLALSRRFAHEEFPYAAKPDLGAIADRAQLLFLRLWRQRS